MVVVAAEENNFHFAQLCFSLDVRPNQLSGERIKISMSIRLVVYDIEISAFRSRQEWLFMHQISPLPPKKWI
jgi:hypothetical protein